MTTHTIYGIEHRTYDRDNYAEWNLWTWDGPIFYTSKEAAESRCVELNAKDLAKFEKDCDQIEFDAERRRLEMTARRAVFIQTYDKWSNPVPYTRPKFSPDFQVEEYELHGDISLLTASR
jgi:hypothetical protein